jgi:chromosome segregation ATPase
MSDFRDFFNSLPSSDADTFAGVLQRLNSESSEGHIAGLKSELSQVKDELDELNAARAELKTRRFNLARAITLLDQRLEQSNSTELVQFRLVLAQDDARLEQLFAETRPDELHKRKAYLRKEIAERRLLGRLTSMILSTAGRSHGS